MTRNNIITPRNKRKEKSEKIGEETQAYNYNAE